jgi:hypothetical protein
MGSIGIAELLILGTIGLVVVVTLVAVATLYAVYRKQKHG